MALGDSGYQSKKCNVFPNSICHSVYIIFHLSKRFDYACINSCRSHVYDYLGFQDVYIYIHKILIHQCQTMSALIIVFLL